ncbi:FAS1-like dehydratase domain-containing protein [Nocardioides sp. J54]|uniref:FAS1-like dehydratase domain-containing protein n=1 Tax=Nocardioides sp. J54 TaxID=935866 RepID=UPI00048D2755|nr:MaoC family dehydratase N-terminal domain-containing protein [Nocardioides sp. J54]
MRSWVGRSREVTLALDAGQADKMCATLDRAPGLADGDVLPPGWHWLYAHDVVEASRLGVDGHPARGVTMPPVPLERRMWAAGELAFHQPLRIGDLVTRRSTVADVVPKRGRSGLLYFVVLTHEHLRDGELVLEERQTVVYKDASAPAASPRSEGDELPAADGTRTWLLDSTALFRYSALTFNSHRIHYDADYAREIEGYPALVVHGPLLATLLMESVAQPGPGPLATFTYQARSPLFVSEPFDVAHRRTPDGAEAWASAADGRLAMTAFATYQEENR